MLCVFSGFDDVPHVLLDDVRIKLFFFSTKMSYALFREMHMNNMLMVGGEREKEKKQKQGRHLE